MSEPEPVISVRGLKKQFPDRAGNLVTVLEDVSFDCYRGETTVIMGGSGCGKSTLLNCLIGELAPEAGAIYYRLEGDTRAANLVELDEDETNRLRRRIGILFQSGALFSSMTVAENVALPLVEHSYVDRSVIDIVVAMKLQQVKMLPHRDKYPSELSGGQKKRAGLARALALDPEILFYDEPTAGLDPVTSAAIDELIISLARKLHVTSVVVTHEMDSAFRIADRMIMLDRGRVLRAGTRAEFDALRRRRPEDLASDADRLIHQFVNGLPTGPLTDAEGMSEYERLLVSG